ncbi:GNAT family N-acetyltransferase [Christensenellaceae bacterium OttesenSCG-928-M15]|nr:GNAT family N-acetyltransferase [Christensenellaceae bacterium OttesenSCG-928-M15]
MCELYDEFPNLQNEKIEIRKMVESDVAALMEISHSDAVYRYISPFLYRKSEKFLQTAIKNFGGRDFDKKKMMIAGIYLQKAPDRLVGLAEMFDYKKKTNAITIGYRIHETYWHQGIASNAIELMVRHLFERGIDSIYAYVMPDNIYSAKALLRNGFTKEDYTVQEKNWGGLEVVDLEVYVLKKLQGAGENI